MACFAHFKDKNQRTAPPEERFVFFISSPMVWSGHVETYLQDRGIPYLKRGQKGAGLALELGPVNEVFDYFIDSKDRDKASQGLEELKALLGS